MRDFVEYEINQNRSVRILMDARNKDWIEKLINKDDRHKSSFDKSLKSILAGCYTTSQYEYYPNDQISAIKFKGENTNPRIYCHQHICPVTHSKTIILIEPYSHKDSFKINKKIKQRFHVIKTYEYETSEAENRSLSD